MVVHRQPDQDHEAEQRDPVDDEARAGEVEQAVEPAVLEDQRQDPNATPTDSRLSTVDSSAIGTLRNADPIITRVSSSTNPITHGSRSAAGAS